MEFTVNSKSWHFRAATYGGFRRVDEGMCWYVWSTIKGLVKFFALVMLAMLLTYSMGDFLAWCAARLVTGETFLPSAFALGMLFGFVLVACALLTAVIIGIIIMLYVACEFLFMKIIRSEVMRKLIETMQNRVCVQIRVVSNPSNKVS